MPYRLARFFSQQIEAAQDALLPLALAIVVTALLVWLLTRWRYRRLSARMDGDEADRAAMGGGWGAADGPVDAEPWAGFTPEGESRAQRKALRAMTNALDSAGPALANGGAEEIDRALPIVGLALTLARSAFAVPVPAYGPDAHANLLASTRWLEHVRPYLRAGEVEEAHRQSTEFLRLNGLQPD